MARIPFMAGCRPMSFCKPAIAHFAVFSAEFNPSGRKRN